MMTAPLMPKATAVWLVENTTISFDQIAEFCVLHPLEVQGIADGDVAGGLIGQDPVASGQLVAGDIEKAEKDINFSLKIVSDMGEYITEQKKKKSRYTPVARRQDKPDAIAWLVKNHPELTNGQIVKLVGTTKKTICAIRDRSHWNISNLQPRDPVLLGVCTQTDLHTFVEKALTLEEKAKKKAEKETKKKQQARGRKQSESKNKEQQTKSPEEQKQEEETEKAEAETEKAEAET